MTKRLFIALNATDPLSTSFLPTYKKLKINADKKEITIKWVPTENFHVTISFLGDREANQVPLIAEALKETCETFTPFDLKVEGVGAFSNEHDARVLWLGIQNKRYLGEFKNALDEKLVALGLFNPMEERAYAPHLTFARLRNPKSVKDMISPFKRKNFGKINVSEIVLYESTLQGAYPIYSPLLRCQLQGQEDEQETYSNLSLHP